MHPVWGIHMPCLRFTQDFSFEISFLQGFQCDLQSSQMTFDLCQILQNLYAKYMHTYIHTQISLHRIDSVFFQKLKPLCTQFPFLPLDHFSSTPNINKFLGQVPVGKTIKMWATNVKYIHCLKAQCQMTRIQCHKLKVLSHFSNSILCLTPSTKKCKTTYTEN